MKIERLRADNSPSYRDAETMFRKYTEEVYGHKNKVVQNIFFGAMVENAAVYTAKSHGFIIVDFQRNPFLHNHGYWVIHSVFVEPNKRNGPTFSLLLREVLKHHDGEIRAMSLAGVHADPIMAKRTNNSDGMEFLPIGNVYQLRAK